LCNLHKIGKYGKEIGKKSGKLSTKLGKIGIFTKSVLTPYPALYDVTEIAKIGITTVG